MFSRLETAPSQWGGNAGVPGGKEEEKKEEGEKNDSKNVKRLVAGVRGWSCPPPPSRRGGDLACGGTAAVLGAGFWGGLWLGECGMCAGGGC